jgi:hypothetical protein
MVVELNQKKMGSGSRLFHSITDLTSPSRTLQDRLEKNIQNQNRRTRYKIHKSEPNQIRLTSNIVTEFLMNFPLTYAHSRASGLSKENQQRVESE